MLACNRYVLCNNRARQSQIWYISHNSESKSMNLAMLYQHYLPYKSDKLIKQEKREISSVLPYH
jgi:hypothetical protein